MLLALLLAAGAATPPSEAILRRIVAETALAQLDRIDPAWPDAQHDCAGLVRFAYRTAFKRLDPARAAAGPFRDTSGKSTQFADAATLLASTFALMGRDDATRAQLRSGDLVAFAREGDEGPPIYHLMLVIRSDDPAHRPTLIVYHPGQKSAPVRSGRLDDLLRDAPPGWRAVSDNPLFLGFYRLKEWTQ
ncbi:MAG TPA: DUF1175 family protein [Anaeromyxobacteraceae bacterium]|nr:DUF1175 family protein [Anaeromyxobacteraceae bacterium]